MNEQNLKMSRNFSDLEAEYIAGGGRMGGKRERLDKLWWSH